MKTILIVDDAMFMREMIRAMLAEGGFEDVAEAPDGEEALRLYGELRPSLTLLDITMPNMDGVETLRRIRQLDADAKVVMCTAVGQERQMIEAVALGAADYLVKPFRSESLLRVVKKLLD